MDIIRSFVELIPVTLAQSLIYAFVALAVMIPFRLLNFPDLSCEGTFPLGGAFAARCWRPDMGRSPRWRRASPEASSPVAPSP
jgi:ABC-type uncharacterized transport system permease subunit